MSAPTIPQRNRRRPAGATGKVREKTTVSESPAKRRRNRREPPSGARRARRPHRIARQVGFYAGDRNIAGRIWFIVWLLHQRTEGSAMKTLVAALVAAGVCLTPLSPAQAIVARPAPLAEAALDIS